MTLTMISLRSSGTVLICPLVAFPNVSLNYQYEARAINVVRTILIKDLESGSKHAVVSAINITVTSNYDASRLIETSIPYAPLCCFVDVESISIEKGLKIYGKQLRPMILRNVRTAYSEDVQAIEFPSLVFCIRRTWQSKNPRKQGHLY